MLRFPTAVTTAEVVAESFSFEVSLNIIGAFDRKIDGPNINLPPNNGYSS